jgi:archaellum component FlaC
MEKIKKQVHASQRNLRRAQLAVDNQLDHRIERRKSSLVQIKAFLDKHGDNNGAAPSSDTQSPRLSKRSTRLHKMSKMTARRLKQLSEKELRMLIEHVAEISKQVDTMEHQKEVLQTGLADLSQKYDEMARHLVTFKGQYVNEMSQSMRINPHLVHHKPLLRMSWEMVGNSGAGTSLSSTTSASERMAAASRK